MLAYRQAGDKHICVAGLVCKGDKGELEANFLPQVDDLVVGEGVLGLDMLDLECACLTGNDLNGGL